MRNPDDPSENDDLLEGSPITPGNFRKAGKIVAQGGKGEKWQATVSEPGTQHLKAGRGFLKGCFEPLAA